MVKARDRSPRQKKRGSPKSGGKRKKAAGSSKKAAQPTSPSSQGATSASPNGASPRRFDHFSDILSRKIQVKDVGLGKVQSGVVEPRAQGPVGATLGVLQGTHAEHYHADDGFASPAAASPISGAASGRAGSRSPRKGSPVRKKSPNRAHAAQMPFDAEELQRAWAATDHLDNVAQTIVFTKNIPADAMQTRLILAEKMLHEKDANIANLSGRVEQLETKLSESENRARLSASYFDKEILGRLKENREQRRELVDFEKRQTQLLAAERSQAEEDYKKKHAALIEEAENLRKENERSKDEGKQNEELRNEVEKLQAKLSATEIEMEQQDRDWHNRFTGSLRMLQQKYQQRFDHSVNMMAGKNKTVMEGIVYKERLCQVLYPLPH